ncbi:MAG: 1,4-dihydroxy-2-naphthoate polyprenyltransferase, partial [uncultured Rubrobacteraceae bacterium]
GGVVQPLATVQPHGGGRAGGVRDGARLGGRGVLLGAVRGDAVGEPLYPGGYQHVQRVLRREARARRQGDRGYRGLHRRGARLGPQRALRRPLSVRARARVRHLPDLRRRVAYPRPRLPLGPRGLPLLRRPPPDRLHARQRGRGLRVHGRADRGDSLRRPGCGLPAIRRPRGPAHRRARRRDTAREQHQGPRLGPSRGPPDPPDSFRPGGRGGRLPPAPAGALRRRRPPHGLRGGPPHLRPRLPERLRRPQALGGHSPTLDPAPPRPGGEAYRRAAPRLRPPLHGRRPPRWL